MLVARTAGYFAISIQEATRATYARRWRHFDDWCAQKGLRPLPAAPETVMLYLADAADGGAALSTIRGWTAAINRVHLEAGHPPPGRDPAMAMFLRGISRVASRRDPRRVNAMRISDVRQVCRHMAACEVDQAAARDLAILALSAEGLSDGAIARLNWDDITITRRTVRLDLRAHGRFRARTLTFRTKSRAGPTLVDVLSRWKLASENHGPVFTSPSRADLHGRRLSKSAIFGVRKSRLSAIGGLTAWQEDPRTLSILAGPPSDVLRDKALILLGFAGAFRRVDLTRLRWRDIRIVREGLVVHLNISKTDVMGRGRDVGIPPGKSALTCPVRAVTAWRQRVEDQLGPSAVDETPVFVQVGRSGRLCCDPITPEAVSRIVQRWARSAGLQGKWGGRSLRAGFISTAADLEIPLELIAEQSRHATLDSLILYIRNDDVFRRNSAARLGM
ncbi:tyrosine-type recombinase/integrase [Phycicoccus sp. MAQZ13P-2]|uniref:tyrosine-type recombinase/integrase n=1 Tax=Phycicoccus mangrovi TaxID=2840470 RepID=UPI001BFFE5C9|nr:tyrosine-type recombinase/integrase [Phycicoccus mangrovi]MBT9275963.1 tyrosine-type recombinase/integrase [Phycicoccus mangrovi]